MKIEDSLVGERIDKVVLEYLHSNGIKSITRTLVQSNIDKGCTVNSNTVKKSYKVRLGDDVNIDVKYWNILLEDLDLSEDIVSQYGELDIRYEDEDLMVVYKPKGLVVHPGVSNTKDTLANYVKYYLESKDDYDNLLDRSGIVHRLDKGVSGLMVIAKSKGVQEYLKKQFQEHKVTKIYLAEVESVGNYIDQEMQSYVSDSSIEDVLYTLDKSNKPWENWYKVEGYMARSSRNRYKMEFKKYTWDSAKYALSYILPFKNNKVLIKIETGRMHQIRATLEYLGLHILGDSLYGVNNRLYEGSNIELESIYLSFVKPDGNTLTVKVYE